MPELITACRVCGLDFTFPENASLHDCPACGTPHCCPRPRGAELDLLRRANAQRAACDYANAEHSYQQVLLSNTDEHEALWGLVLCKYGVEYVQDKDPHTRRPVVHFLCRKPITEDADYRHACACAPLTIRRRYMADAEYISQIQTGVLAAQADGREFDIFLCCKGSVPGGTQETRELDWARQLYYSLTGRGYRVFFARETLSHHTGADYEAQVFHALQSARMMLVVCGNPEYLSTPWVRSEWSRYLERIDAGEDCRLIPLLYDACNIADLPKAFNMRCLQSLRMDTLHAEDDLRETLQRFMPTPDPVSSGFVDEVLSAGAPQSRTPIQPTAEQPAFPARTAPRAAYRRSSIPYRRSSTPSQEDSAEEDSMLRCSDCGRLFQATVRPPEGCAVYCPDCYARPYSSRS